ncbi:MAG: site-2 protease family protein [Halovenus sp.]
MRNYTLFHVWDIPIRINVSLVIFLPILAWLIGSGTQLAAYVELIEAVTPAAIDPTVLAEEDRWVVGILAAVGLFASVAVHELGHAWAAMRYGIGTESITLWILGGLASLTEMPREWNREFWIAIAGPITSLLLGVAAYALLFVVPESATLAVFVVGFVTVMNLVLAVFNLLPAFPMDGGRILRALLARNRSYVSATRTAASVGTVFALLFAVFGILVTFSPLLLLLALFIYAAATSESRSVVLGELLDGLSVGDLVADNDPIEADATVAEALDRLLRARRSDLAVVADGTVVGAITASELRDVPHDERESTAVGDITTTDLPRLDSATTAFDALYELMTTRSDTAIVEHNGSPVGVVSRADFTAVLDVRRDTVSF